jgi:hypothetical protein
MKWALRIIRRFWRQTRRAADRGREYKVSWWACGWCTCACCSDDFLSCWAMPLGADLGGGRALALAVGGGISSLLLLLCAKLWGGDVSLAGGQEPHGAVSRRTWRHAYPLLRSRPARRMFMAIIRQVRFSMRSALGSCVFALEYSFQIWVPRGSFFCICSGDSALGLLASLPNAGNMASSSMPLRAASSVGERSIMPSGTAKSMNGRENSACAGEGF